MKKVIVKGKFESQYIYSFEDNKLLLRISDHKDKAEKFDFNTGEHFKPEKVPTVIVNWQEPLTLPNLEKLNERHRNCWECEKLNKFDEEEFTKGECSEYLEELQNMKNFYQINAQKVDEILKENGMERA